ncbi:endonuclease domain-containing protein [Gryllotalpicola ginsengisoli]|uniref:endonuclease domain-containing protein n=1 Tax=Gryllotalpicola ginsengisoli TaxID=444608 RepID=UPI0003B71C33|nr:DUF559 domain-containing protein [Gryllotalpicola ginsengisoli]
MQLDQILDLNDGFATRAALRSAGFSARRIRAEIAQGRLIALGRDIVARPGAGRSRRRAVEMHARLACVSAARLMGLWAIDDGRLHVVPRSLNSHFAPDGRSPEVVAHWSPAPLEPDRHRVAVESGRNALMHIARCQPLSLAVATFDSAIRQRFISVEELRRLASARRDRFARVVAHVSDQSDSGLESITRVGLREVGLTCREQVIIDGHPVDLLVGETLIIQLDGRHHLDDPAQLARDRWQDRRLRRMGYTVLRFGYADVVHNWPATLAEILAHVGHGVTWAQA